MPKTLNTLQKLNNKNTQKILHYTKIHENFPKLKIHEKYFQYTKIHTQTKMLNTYTIYKIILKIQL